MVGATLCSRLQPQPHIVGAGGSRIILDRDASNLDRDAGHLVCSTTMHWAVTAAGPYCVTKIVAARELVLNVRTSFIGHRTALRSSNPAAGKHGLSQEGDH